MLAEKSTFTITRMVRLLEVSRSGYYAWIKRGPSMRALRGEIVSRKTVAKVMRCLGLKGVCPKRWKTTTITNTTDTYPVDVVQRKWDTGRLN
jgi:hypothetical protein